MAKTEAGFWLGSEPVDVAQVASVDELVELLLKAVARGNPVVETPTRDNFPPPVMGKYCGMKSLSAFERTANCWAISRDDSYGIVQWIRSERHRGAWEEDSAERTLLPLNTPLEDVVRQAAERALSE